MNKTKSGFTIVELLIVIVVIGILAAITTVAYSGIQNRARLAKINQDISQLKRAVLSARIQQDKPLSKITGSGCTGCECKYSQSPADALPYYDLPSGHSCWQKYYNSLDKISEAAGTNLSQLKSGDPWGSPYFIDENETTSSDPCFAKDTIMSVGSSGKTDGGTRTGSVSIPFYSVTCG